MKTALGLAAALSFAALGALATPAMAQQGGSSAMETGSNATDTKGAGMSKSGKMSGAMQGKKMKKKKM